ncbi:MAG: response regulator [Verrucomicrobiae bacterium]|nr:response regulator [Verrucomicrobiae bacterium]MDW8309274.1 response regulator [Verrucomicrobiales bacterium]
MKKILFIEDDQIVANAYRNKLTAEGYRVEVALDGEVGRELVRSFQPDAILLDLMLPKVSGLDLLREIRSQPGLEQVPVIVLSNTYLSSMVQAAWKAGATKCLSKVNCTPRQVLEVIRSLVGRNGEAAPAVASPPPAATEVASSPASPAAVSHPVASAPPVAETPAPEALQQAFFKELSGALPALRQALQHVIRATEAEARTPQLQEMYRRVHGLTGGAALAGLPVFAQVGDAFEALLKELCDKPHNVNASTLRTVASAVDFLGVLLERGVVTAPPEAPGASILVVDDDTISRRAVTYALDKARLKSVAVDHPETAFDLMLQRQFDLVILDVNMPGMNGFELCAKLRTLSKYQKVPVIFVTALNDFESRANSTISGGNDFIAKPFLFVELAVKALIYVLRARLETPVAS